MLFKRDFVTENKIILNNIYDSKFDIERSTVPNPIEGDEIPEQGE
jgi:hypothetical protein